MRAKRLLNKLKHTEEQECLWFSSDQINFHQDEKVNRRNDRWVCASGPIEIPTVMHAHEVSSNSDAFRVNADTDAYMGTLQTIGVKPPSIDSVANGGRSYVL
ncbi:hypothetical protein ACTXT7_012537 [Hymenolepis weldensis]